MTGEPRGFTLVELMLVIACLAVLAAIAVPKWIVNVRPAYRLKNAAYQVVGDIRLARIRAVATNRQYRLRFDPVSDFYLLEKGDLPSGSESWAVEGSSRYFGSYGDPSYGGVNIAGEEEYSVIFRPTGGITPTTVTLQNTVGQTMKVICSMAGRIRVVKE